MVQYRPRDTPPTDSRLHPKHKWYWKLEHYDEDHSRHWMQNRLQERDFYFKTSSVKTRLIKLLSRSERGLLSYDKCSAVELRIFCSSRLLRLHGKERKQQLIYLLEDEVEDEDEEATFEQFLELPSELRTRIYSFHFQEFEDFKRPVPPPITEVSRQFRHETLLLFYGTCMMTIEISPSAHYYGNNGVWFIEPSRMMASKDARTTFSYIPEKFLRVIRRLNIKGAVFVPEI